MDGERTYTITDTFHTIKGYPEIKVWYDDLYCPWATSWNKKHTCDDKNFTFFDPTDLAKFSNLFNIRNKDGTAAPS